MMECIPKEVIECLRKADRVECNILREESDNFKRRPSFRIKDFRNAEEILPKIHRVENTQNRGSKKCLK
jgi:hypothetical protein